MLREQRSPSFVYSGSAAARASAANTESALSYEGCGFCERALRIVSAGVAALADPSGETVEDGGRR